MTTYKQVGALTGFLLLGLAGGYLLGIALLPTHVVALSTPPLAQIPETPQKPDALQKPNLVFVGPFDHAPTVWEAQRILTVSEQGVLVQILADGQQGLLLQSGDSLASNGLVRLDALLPGSLFKLRYTTADNFTKVALYPPDAGCYLTVPAANALFMAASALIEQHLGLLIYDCYRPLPIQLQMFKAHPDGHFVAPPPNGGNHNRGAAVDVGLVDANLEKLLMPSDHDEFNAAKAGAWVTTGISKEAIQWRTVLQKAMTGAGFRINNGEWWHFDGPGGLKKPLSVDFPGAQAPVVLSY